MNFPEINNLVIRHKGATHFKADYALLRDLFPNAKLVQQCQKANQFTFAKLDGNILVFLFKNGVTEADLLENRNPNLEVNDLPENDLPENGNTEDTDLLTEKTDEGNGELNEEVTGELTEDQEKTENSAEKTNAETENTNTEIVADSEKTTKGPQIDAKPKTKASKKNEEKKPTSPE